MGRLTVLAAAVLLAGCGEPRADSPRPLTAAQRAAMVSLARAIEDEAPDVERYLSSAEVVTLRDFHKGQVLLIQAGSVASIIRTGRNEAKTAELRDMPQTAKDIRAVLTWKKAGIVYALKNGSIEGFDAALDDLSAVKDKGWPVDSVPLELRR